VNKIKGENNMKILRGRADQEDKFKKQIQEYKNKGYNVSLFTTDTIVNKSGL
jgi:pyridoxine 5'-phosphate synthase PdxJ